MAILDRVTVDAVGVEERAAALASRSIKKHSKVAGLRLAIACTDLTTLEGGVVGLVVAGRLQLLGLVSALLPPLSAGNAVICAVPAAHYAVAVPFAEAVATADVPAGVLNMLTAEIAERRSNSRATRT